MARKSATDPNAPPAKKRARRKTLGFVIQQVDPDGKWSDLVDDATPLFNGVKAEGAEPAKTSPEPSRDPLKFKETRAALDYLQGSQLEGEFRVCQVTAVVAVKLETIKRAVVKSVV